jgi:hypothetical protein
MDSAWFHALVIDPRSKKEGKNIQALGRSRGGSRPKSIEKPGFDDLG